jgi:hypothetical protein
MEIKYKSIIVNPSLLENRTFAGSIPSKLRPVANDGKCPPVLDANANRPIKGFASLAKGLPFGQRLNDLG